MEQWKTITGYDNYEVSTEGNVRNVKTGRIITQHDNGGYLKVNLHKNGKRKVFYIHRLVAIAFIPNPQNKPTVNHIDENKHNNRVDNLEWATYGEQQRHGTRNERDKQAKSKKVRCIETGQTYDSMTQASEETGLDKASICKVCKGKGKTCGGLHWEYV